MHSLTEDVEITFSGIYSFIVISVAPLRACQASGSWALRTIPPSLIQRGRTRTEGQFTLLGGLQRIPLTIRLLDLGSF